MEPTKTEKQFRDGLQNHEIQPSLAAWDRLDAMLTVAEKPKKKYKYMPVAASLIGFFIITAVLVWQSTSVIDKDNTNEVVISKPIIKPAINMDNNIVTDEKSQKEQHANVPIQSTTYQKVSNQKLNSQKGVADHKNVKKENNGVQSSSTTIINQKQAYANVPQKEILQVVSVAETQQQKPKYIDAAALLADIDSKKPTTMATIKLQQSTYKANAKALLSQVDGELNQTFRQKVFQKISSDFQSIKVTVAERNNN